MKKKTIRIDDHGTRPGKNGNIIRVTEMVTGRQTRKTITKQPTLRELILKIGADVNDLKERVTNIESKLERNNIR